MSVETVHRRIASDYVEAFNGQDIARLAELFDDGVTLRDWSLQAEGRDAVLEANRGIFSSVRSIHASVLKSVAEGNIVVLELDIVVDGQERLKVVDVLEFNETGRLIAIRAFKG